ncbi:MAG: geranylgeranyl diphosphate synthase type II [Saprospiraceae bacterium]|jgi:geranylgeranyl diphosphate synthase type II
MITIEKLRHLFLSYLNENRFVQQPGELYEPVNYIMELSGKRMRPVMLLMAYQLFDDKVEKALPAAYAVEMFHNFSLVHDDIMDEAPLRRGQATVHNKYGVNTGILSGDVMLIYAYDFLLKISETKNLPKIIRLFNDTSIKVCEGQQLDMNFETQEVVLIEEYIKMISFKTAALLAGSMKIGALIADADDRDAELIYAFAWNIGIAFQIQDDILDTYGDPEKFGKKVGGDIIQNKKTYLILKALEMADDATAKSLSVLMSTPTTDEKEKIDLIKGMLDRLNIRQEAEKIKETYQNKAFEALNAINIENSKKHPLIEIANQLINRET